MRLALFLLAALLATPARARAQAAAPAPHPLDEPAPVIPLSPDEALADANSARRQALFDLGFNALVDGNLPLAERAFSEAAALPGDPAQSGVAGLFADRVQQLRVRRRADAQSGIAGITARPAAPRLDRQVGRTERIAIMGSTTALGLGLYGWTLPGAMGVDAQQSARAFVGLYMITAGSSFVVPYLLLRDKPVTPGQANLAFYGGTRGIWHGVLMGALIAGEIGINHRTQAWKASMLLGSLGEMVGGYHLSRSAHLSAGDARTMAAMGDYGLAMGFGTGFLFRFDGQPQDCHQFTENPACFGRDPQVDSHSRKMAAAGLIGSGLGLAGGYFLAKRRDNTWGDGEVLRAGIVLGAWTAAGVTDLTNRHGDWWEDFSDRKYTGGLMIGATGGLIIGERLVRNTTFSPGQSMLIDLSMISGGLLGAGATYVIPGESRNRPFLFASALGSLAGFALGYWGFYDAPETPATRRLSRLSATGVSLIPTVGGQGQHGLALAGMF